MISSKKEYKLYLKEDKKANMGGVSSFKFFIKAFVKTDDYRAYKLCRLLRKYEYVYNCVPNNLIYRIYKRFLYFKYYNECKKSNVFIVPNTVGYGLKIQHITGGGNVIVPYKVGNYFSIRQYTTVGKGNGDKCPIIGDNVTLGANVTIIGDIRIGDNCIIGAGAVVVKSIPANSIVVGNPGKVIGKRIDGKVY